MASTSAPSMLPDGGLMDPSFLMMTASGPSGTVTNYSPRFGLTGMTAQFPANVAAGIADIGSSTSGPKTSNIEVQGSPEEGADAPAGSYAVPYNAQQGLTRYAPMQPQPRTKITANPKTVKPLQTPSSAPIAHAFLPIPKIQTTMTQSRPVTVTSVVNNVGDGQSLVRWTVLTYLCRLLLLQCLTTRCRSSLTDGRTEEIRIYMSTISSRSIRQGYETQHNQGP